MSARPFLNYLTHCQWRWILCLVISLLAACRQMPTQPSAIQEPEPPAPAETQQQVNTCDCSEPVRQALNNVPACPEAAPPAPVKKKKPAKAPKPIDEKLIVGYVERIELKPENISLKARIDTGAGLSSINGVDIIDFERDGQRWIKFAMLDPDTKEKIYLERPVKRYKMIKQLSGPSQRRPVVSLGVKLGPIEEQVETTVTDRSGYLYQVLIGRNFLRDRVIVDVSKKFVAKRYEQ